MSSEAKEAAEKIVASNLGITTRAKIVERYIDIIRAEFALVIAKAAKCADLEAALTKILATRDKAAAILRNQQLQDDPDNIPPEYFEALAEFGTGVTAAEELLTKPDESGNNDNS